MVALDGVEGEDGSAGVVVNSDGSSAVISVCDMLGLLLLADFAASNPVLWIMEPSLRERMRVDWTPGRDVRCERRAVTCWGTCEIAVVCAIFLEELKRVWERRV